MSFGTEMSYYSDLMSECKDQGPDPDAYGATLPCGRSRYSAIHRSGPVWGHDCDVRKSAGGRPLCLRNLYIICGRSIRKYRET